MANRNTSAEPAIGKVEKIQLPILILRNVERRSCEHTKSVPGHQHSAVGKETGETAHVERWNNTLRQCLAHFVRKTLSFSKSPLMHEACLLLFLHRYNRERTLILGVEQEGRGTLSSSSRCPFCVQERHSSFLENCAATACLTFVGKPEKPGTSLLSSNT